jgi:hypothetical protein
MKQKILLSVISLFISAFIFAQETITISGVVRDEKKLPMPGATVLQKGTANGTATDDAGKFTLKVPKDCKELVVSYIGYDEKTISIDPSKGPVSLTIDMASSNLSLNQVVVSVSRRKEKMIDAPASISVLGQEEISRNVVTSVADQLKTTSGIDIIRTGLVSSDVVVRGLNDIFSTAALYVVDNRIGAVPSLRVNAQQLTPVIDLDYDKIEVVRGPASALYGPNASSGVISILTKSPLEQEKKFETTISMMSGFTVLDTSYYRNRTYNLNGTPYNNGSPISGNIINPEIRTSGKLLDGKFGYKVSASYFQGQDYPVIDPREPYTGDTMVFGTARNGVVFSPDTIKYKVGNKDTSRLDTRVFRKDFFIRKWTTDARIDIRPIKTLPLLLMAALPARTMWSLPG